MEKETLIKLLALLPKEKDPEEFKKSVQKIIEKQKPSFGTFLNGSIYGYNFCLMEIKELINKELNKNRENICEKK